MAEDSSWEFALDLDREVTANTDPAVLGEGDFKYEVSGKNWGNLPEDWYYKEATAVAVNSKGQVYIFNRGTHPMLVLDREGNVESWCFGAFGTICADRAVFMERAGGES